MNDSRDENNKNPNGDGNTGHEKLMVRHQSFLNDHIELYRKITCFLLISMKPNLRSFASRLLSVFVRWDKRRKAGA